MVDQQTTCKTLGNLKRKNPTFVPNFNEKSKLKKTLSYNRYAFDKFYDNMLLVWITGLEAEYAEGLSYQEISKTLTQLLRQLLDNNNIPEPNKIIMYSFYFASRSYLY